RRPLSLCTFHQRCGSRVSGSLLKLSALAVDNTSVLFHMGRKHKNPPWLSRRQGTIHRMVQDAILARCTSHEIRRISLASSGLVTLLEDGLMKVTRGLHSSR